MTPKAVTVTGLHVYPVKSCRGIAMPEVRVTVRGLEYDREWMIVRPDGTALTQREAPRLALIVAALSSSTLDLSAPGQGPIQLPLHRDRVPTDRREVRIWNHVCPAWDEGDAAAGWLSQFLGEPVRLVRFMKEHRRLSDPAWTGGVEAANAFSDGYPILVLSEESLADLNDRLMAESAVDGPLLMNRFRPNVVVAGGGPYIEDFTSELAGDGVILRLVKPCTRCRITTVDQATGETGAEPLRTLARYRRDARLGGVTLGQNAIAIAGIGQTLRVGMSMEARESRRVSS